VYILVFYFCRLLVLFQVFKSKNTDDSITKDMPTEIIEQFYGVDLCLLVFLINTPCIICKVLTKVKIFYMHT